jgi:hypothetical protein
MDGAITANKATMLIVRDTFVPHPEKQCNSFHGQWSWNDAEGYAMLGAIG